MENFRHSAISNPYTSPFIRSTTSEAPSLDNISNNNNNNVIDSSTSRKNFSYLKVTIISFFLILNNRIKTYKPTMTLSASTVPMTSLKLLWHYAKILRSKI